MYAIRSYYDYVVTNAHVIPESMEIEKGETLAIFVRDDNNVLARKVEKVATDQDHDLVLLKLNGTALPPLQRNNFV